MDGNSLAKKPTLMAVFFGMSLLVATIFTVPLATSAQTLTLPLWPTGAPEPAQTPDGESHTSAHNPKEPGVALDVIRNVTVPTLALYPAPAGVPNSHAAAVVFPGGGYGLLAYTLEGEEPCAWFNSLGMSCVLVKYRVPWDGRYPELFGALEDAQQAMRITRAHAKEWKIDPDRVGVLGFSAGGHLAVALSQHFDDVHVLSTGATSEVNAEIDARPNFVILGYPAYLAIGPDRKTLHPELEPNKKTPPTFIVQAEDDKNYVDSALVYYRALKDAGVPAEMHLYGTGGHGFGMHPLGMPEFTWAAVAATWLHEINILP